MELANGTPATPRPHAVLFPFPAQGHVRPLMQLAQRLIHAYGFRVTFVNTSYIHKRLGLQDPRNVADGLHFVDLQECFPDKYYTTEAIRTLILALANSGPIVKEFIKKLHLASPTPITCVISDLLFLEAHNAATHFNLPSIGFSTHSALALSAKHYAPGLVNEGLIPLPQPNRPTKSTVAPSLHKVWSPEEAEALAREVTCIPGLYPMRLRELHTSLLVPDMSETVFKYFTTQTSESLLEREWTLVNTFHDLEAPVIEAFQQDTGIKLTAIGPLVIGPTADSAECYGVNSEETFRSSFWPEESKCIDWLDKQKPASVVYVSLGSLTPMSSSVLEKFVLGLEDSQVPFLLVFRSNLVDGSRDLNARILPAGFEERTKDRALTVSWAPQLKVLGHPATVGFVTHSGWNSVIESISMGVPMLGYPYFADQPMNNRYVVSVWKTGWEFERQADGSVKRQEVAKKVRILASLHAKERDVAVLWKDAARRAVNRGGSSHRNMMAFVHDMYRKAQVLHPCRVSNLNSHNL